jgi:hypothetical protein
MKYQYNTPMVRTPYIAKGLLIIGTSSFGIALGLFIAMFVIIKMIPAAPYIPLDQSESVLSVLPLEPVPAIHVTAQPVSAVQVTATADLLDRSGDLMVTPTAVQPILTVQ